MDVELLKKDIEHLQKEIDQIRKGLPNGTKWHIVKAAIKEQG
jgi:hypothetical protein